MDERLLTILFLSNLFSLSLSQSILQITKPFPFSGDRKILRDDTVYCDSWRYAVETNNAGVWKSIPTRCQTFVKDYVTGDRYTSDSAVASGFSSEFAKSVEVAGDGKDAWVFDIDETLLSNMPYYALHGYGSEAFDETSWDEWVELAEAPALPASLSFYKELQQLNFTIFLLTGRSEPQRNTTTKNLIYAGYSNWERLILRNATDEGKLAIVYKSEKRAELEGEGYRIHGSSGDQWSDLNGYATATRSFKLPNPMYFIS